MQGIKEAFIGTDALLLVVGLVEEPLQRHPRMTETDALMVQLVIAFLRNIIAIPDKAKGTGMEHAEGCLSPHPLSLLPFVKLKFATFV